MIYRQLKQQVFFFGYLLVLVSGWASTRVPPRSLQTRSPNAALPTRVPHDGEVRRSLTDLFMFDWMKSKNDNDSEKEDNGNNPFANFFNAMNPTTPAAAAPAAEKYTKEDDTAKSVESSNDHPSTTVTKRFGGTVNWFNTQRGFGFITPDDENLIEVSDGEDLFVHHSAIQDHTAGFRKLRVGERVEFQVERDSQSRHRAIQVTGPHLGPVQEAIRRAERRNES